MSRKSKPVVPAVCTVCSGTKQDRGHECYRCKTDKDWSRPFPLTKVEVVFSAGALDYMPPEEEIPAEFWRGRGHSSEIARRWHQFLSDWLFAGFKHLELYEVDGVDPEVAWDHLLAIKNSYAPRHQHKEASIAYLGSLWFKDFKYDSFTREEIEEFRRQAKAEMEARRDAVGRPEAGGAGTAEVTSEEAKLEEEVLPSPPPEPEEAPERISGEPRRCDGRCRQCSGTNLAVCPGGQEDPPTCWTWALPCRYLKVHGGWHFHLCKVGKKLRST